MSGEIIATCLAIFGTFLIGLGIVLDYILVAGVKMSEELEVLKEIRDEMKEIKEKISEQPVEIRFVEEPLQLEPECTCGDSGALGCPTHGPFA